MLNERRQDFLAFIGKEGGLHTMKYIAVLFIFVWIVSFAGVVRRHTGPLFPSGAFYSKDATTQDWRTLRPISACYEVACKAR